MINSIGVDGSGYKQYKSGPGLLVSFTHTENILLWVTLDKGEDESARLLQQVVEVLPPSHSCNRPTCRTGFSLASGPSVFSLCFCPSDSRWRHQASGNIRTH